MTIKEAEKLLSISRANIRFYEKEGLFATSRKENNYRDYTEENIQELKRIILLRKLGFTIDEIKALQNGEATLPAVAEKNMARLESELVSLKGSMKLTKRLIAEETSFEALDEAYYQEMIHSEEEASGAFATIAKDYLKYELDCFDIMWKFIFFYDFKQSRKKHGVAVAAMILLLLCVVRGMVSQFLLEKTFLHGFLYPFVLFAAVGGVTTALYFLLKKAPKMGSIVIFVLFAVLVLALGGIIGVFLILFFNSFFHFLF